MLQNTVLSFSGFLLDFSNLKAGVTVREQKSLSLQYSLNVCCPLCHKNTCVNIVTAGNIFATAPSCIIQNSCN